MCSEDLRQRVRSALEAVAKPDKAGPMQAYMKSSLPFLGVQKPDRARALKPILTVLRFRNAREWEQAVRAIWDGAHYREERYAALAIARDRRQAPHRRALKMDALPLYEHLVVTGAWWDLVDEVAPNLVQELLSLAPADARARMRAWAVAPDLWKRRASIICQLGRRFEVDTDLLTSCIEPNLRDREFFIRKAIGWALRDLAWKEPQTVRELVERYGDRLSALSRREALKNIRN